LCFFACLCAISICAAASATAAAEPSLIALVNVSTPLAALVTLTTLNHQILFLQLFQAAEASSKDLIKTPPKYSPNGLTTLNSPGTHQLLQLLL
jgi:hypothetical protein